jgi:hypothetical protein
VPDNDTGQTTDPGGDESQNLPQVREALNRERERRAALEGEVAELQQSRREAAFLRAGVDLDSPSGDVVFKAYEGELDPAAIQGFAARIPGALRTGSPPPDDDGASGQPAPAPDDGPTPDEQRQARIESGLSGETAPPGAVPEKQLGHAMMDAAFAANGGQRVRPSGGMGDRAMAAGLQVLMNRAVDGDPEAVFKRADETIGQATDRWRQRQQ